MATSYDPTSPNEQPVPLPDAPLRKINQHLSLQPPLTRRGSGPGILLFLPNAIAQSDAPKPLDPEPIQKWAEEGFAVAALTGVLPNGSIAETLNGVVSAFLQLGDQLDTKDKFGVVVYDPEIIQAVSQAVDGHSLFSALVAYGSPPSFQHSKPSLLHKVADQNSAAAAAPTEGTYSYPVSSPYFVLPYSAEYDTGSAGLAHTRSLVFLRKHLGGPNFDIEAVWEEHTFCEFVARSVAKTMATMVAEPYVNNVPTMTGGIGRENVTRFYRDHFIFQNPPDVRLQAVSRTIGPDRVVDEFVYHMTHDRTFDILLPGVPATGKKLAVPTVGVVNIRGDRVASEHIWWDQATVLLQAGILPTHLPYPTPEGQGKRLLRLPIAGVEAADKLLDVSKGTSNEMLSEDWGLVSEAALQVAR